jgi:siroheme synthase-like protein
MKEEGVPYYPVFLKVKGRKCVVVGGGEVALRKVLVLLEHDTDLQVISPELCPGLAELADSGKIRVINREYREGDLKNTFITIAATDDRDTNRRVAADARRESVPANVVDDSENSDFILPSYLRRGDITVAISTGGRSPALARKLRTRLEKEMGAEYAKLARLVGEVRMEVIQQGIYIDSEAWQEALDLDLLLDLLRKGEKEKAREVLAGNLKEKHNLSL